MTLDEVRLVINGWVENQPQLALIGELWGFSLAVRCRAQFITDEYLVGLVTSDGGRIAIDISEPGVDFRYSQMREFPEFAKKWNLTAAQAFASSLMVVFPPREVSEQGEVPHRESVGFTELSE